MLIVGASFSRIKRYVYIDIIRIQYWAAADNSTGNLTLRWTPANVSTERIRYFVNFVVQAFIKWIYI
jgi:hypothetical protein